MARAKFIWMTGTSPMNDANSSITLLVFAIAALLRVRGEFLAKPRDGFFLLWKPATEPLPLCGDEPIQAPSAGHTSLGHTPAGSGMPIALKVDVPRLPCKEVNP